MARYGSALALWAWLLLAGCSSVPLAPQPPPGFDLTGTWALVPERSDAAPTFRRLQARGSRLAYVARDFAVLAAREMRIEQGPRSMGVRYDGRRYRDVSWGSRRDGLWEVRAGWHEGRLVILSDADDADARETFVLSADGRRLRVEVELASGGDDLSSTRVFARRPDNAPP